MLFGNFITLKLKKWLIFSLIFLFNICFSSTENSSNWNWHQQFPWVYSDAESDWHYWRAGSDGRFYLWKNKDKKWYRFDTTYSKWISTDSDSYLKDSNYTRNKEEEDKNNLKENWNWDWESYKDNSEEKKSIGSENFSISVNGVVRQFILYTPSTYDSTVKVPLLFNFHGFGSTADDHMNFADMRSLADIENFILVYPQGSLFGGYPHWNASPLGSDNKSTTDDTSFVDAMITSISSSYQIDTTRIYVCGYSNGGMMSYFLGASMSDKIAAIGSMSGTMLEGNPTPSNPVPMINIHGTADSILPYSGGEGSKPTVNTLTYWAEQNGASATPVNSKLYSGNLSVEKSVYFDSNGTAWVEHYKVFGGGHTWIDLNINGQNSNQLIWDFFKKHDLNGPRTNQ